MMQRYHKVYLGFGGNLVTPFGGPAETISAATMHLLRDSVLQPNAQSQIYRSPAWPVGGQPDYANAVLCVETELLPMALLRLTQQTERAFGRVRREKWGPRPLDIDILDFAGLVTEDPMLMLPHPWIAERSFVLAPLAAIAPDWRHPESGRSAGDLLQDLGEAPPKVWEERAGPVLKG